MSAAAQICRHPHCGRGLHVTNVSGVCRAHNHAAFCACDRCVARRGAPEMPQEGQSAPGAELAPGADEVAREGDGRRVADIPPNSPGVHAPGAFSGAMDVWPGADAPIGAWCRPVSARLRPMTDPIHTRSPVGRATPSQGE